MYPVKEGRVCKIETCVQTKEGTGGIGELLCGLRLVGDEGEILLECGKFNKEDGANWKLYSMLLGQEEQIVGFRSKSMKDKSLLGRHYDIEFLVCIPKVK